MGQINILVESNGDRIKDLFKELRVSSERFYNEFFDPTHADIDAMEIRGRLDFINKNGVDEANIRTAMAQYIEAIKRNDVEAVYLESRDSLLGRSAKDMLAYIQVAMYGQLTCVNQSLFSNVIETIYKSISTIELTVVYESFSSLMRGSENYTPSQILIESGPQSTLLEISPEIEPVDITSLLNNKRRGLSPKESGDEYFKIGHNPKVI